MVFKNKRDLKSCAGSSPIYINKALLGTGIFLILKPMDFFKKRFYAVGFATAGLRSAFGGEVHLKIHAVAAILVIALGLCFPLSAIEWFMLLTCICLVICFELLNTALERLSNLVSREQHPAIRYCKDVAAGAVLVSCILAVITSLFVFLPHLRRLF